MTALIIFAAAGWLVALLEWIRACGAEEQRNEARQTAHDERIQRLIAEQASAAGKAQVRWQGGRS